MANIYSDTLESNIIDSKSRNIIELTDLLFDRVIENLKIPTELKYFLDQWDIWIKNFDIVVSILNIYSFYNWPMDDKTLSDVIKLINSKIWLSIYSWVNRWEIIDLLSDALDLQVFSFKTNSALFTKVLEAKLPYEICMWISDTTVNEYSKKKLDGEKYEVSTIKSFVWYNTIKSDKLTIFNTYWKRLDQNKFTILNPQALLDNFILSNTWYIFFPKKLLWQEKLNFIKMNQWLTQNWQESMKRWMWNWEHPNELVTRDMLAEYILANKKRNYLQ